MSLARVPVTLAAALAFHVSMSPPSTPETDTLQDDDRHAVSATARFMSAILTKGLFWASALTDTLAVLAPYIRTLHFTGSASFISVPSVGTLFASIKHPTKWRPALGLSFPPSVPLSLRSFPPLPPMVVAGTALALSGAYLRYAAYRALGQFYACPNRGLGPCAPRGVGRLSRLRPRAKGHVGHAHALITTGPYAVVRHPGCAGLVLCTTGLVLLQFDAVNRTSGMSVGMRTVALVCAVLAIAGASRRVRDEETSLKARFKGEWEAWARAVPYKLVPGVY